MLDFFRKEKNQFFVKGIMILLAASFVFLGFTGYMSGATNSATVIKTKNHKLNIREFHGMVENSVQMMKYYSPSFNTKMFINNPAFFNNFLRQLSYTSLVDSYGKDRSFLMSNKQAFAIISNTKEFQNANGEFDYNTFRYAIQNAGYTEKGFVNKIKADSIQKLTNQILTIPSIVPTSYKENFFKIENETKKVELVEVLPKNFLTTTKAPSKEDLKALYEQKKSEFMTAETRNISYLKIENSIENSEEIAENILDDIIGGESLSALAKKYSVMKYDRNSIELNKANKDEIVQNNLQTIFSLGENEESPVISHKKALIIFYCNSIKESSPKSFSAVKSELLKDWNNKKKSEAAYKALNDVIKTSKEGKSLREAAALNGLKLKTIEVKKSNDKLEEKLKDAIFATDKENSEFIIMGEEKYYLFSIKNTSFPNKNIAKLTEEEVKNVDQAFQLSLSNEQIEKLQNQYKLKVYTNVIQGYAEQYGK